MEQEPNNNKKDYIVGIVGLIAIAVFTIVGVIIKNLFFVN